MNIFHHHLREHYPRGFGSDPANCPVCPHEHPEIMEKIDELRRGKAIGQVALSVIGATLAAYIVERFIRGKV